MRAGCARYRSWMHDRLDGTLGEPRQEALREHLDACPRCEALHREWLRLEVGLAAAPPAPPADLPGQIMARVRATDASAAAARRRRGENLTLWSALVLSGVLVGALSALTGTAFTGFPPWLPGGGGDGGMMFALPRETAPGSLGSLALASTGVVASLLAWGLSGRGHARRHQLAEA